MSLVDFEGELTAAVDRLRPSVVAIERTAPAAAGSTEPIPVGGAGSGVIWERTGLVVTNDHVVRESPRVRVRLADGTERSGTTLGSDPLTDVAVVRLAGEPVPAAPKGDSAALRVGQIALAIGHSLGLPGGPTVSLGVVSAINRPLPGTDFVLEGLIQTDAAINPGNSGGPLADVHGSVIGLNSAVVPHAQGVGFAVPVNTVSTIVRQLLASGRVVRPWLGIHGAGVDESLAKRFDLTRARGVLVWDAVDGGPAHRAGLREGDVVTRVGSSGIRGFHDLIGALSALPIGAVVDLGFVRRGSERSTLVQIEESPASVRRT